MDIRIPFALTKTKHVTLPTEGVKGVDYFCPECNGPVIFRSGTKVRHHFAHKSLTDCRFNSEGWLHFSAKFAVYGSVLRWLNQGANSPVIERTCRHCHDKIKQKLPEKVKHVALEHRVHTENGLYIADIALLDDENNILCAVEIQDTHKVDDKKKLSNQSSESVKYFV